MSKALTKAQSDLEALRLELEAWIATESVKPKPTRKPAVKRTRAQLVAAATAPAEDVDTSWLDLLSPASVAAPVAVVEPAPVVAPAPLYVDATGLIHIELNPPHILDFPEPQPVPVRRTLRQAFRDGYNSYGK